MQKNFDCRYFLDNHDLCILEITTPHTPSISNQNSYEWLLLHKADRSIEVLSLKSRDESTEVQERYFNLGYLKFNPKEGIFIETGNKGQHPLETGNFKGMPVEYQLAVEDFLSMQG